MAMYEKEVKNTNINDYRFKYVAVSDNAKTGKMSAVYTATCESKTGSCPIRCPFASAGCYAKNGPCNIHWENTVTSETNINNLNETIKTGKKHKNILRHNVAGDMANTGSNELNQNLVEKLASVYNDNFETAYTYTHCSVNQRNIEIVKAAAEKNFVINFSTEKVSDCKKCLAAGVNCVIACNTMQPNTVIIDGIKIVKCPNATNKNIKCVNCGLCYMKNRQFAIAFPVHGTKKEQVKKSGILINL